jgi:hypothetical protein
MNQPFRIIQLDEIEITKHVDLQTTDRCYYWRGIPRVKITRTMKQTRGKSYVE